MLRMSSDKLQNRATLRIGKGEPCGLVLVAIGGKATRVRGYPE
jgi:hypothetical protein